MNRAFIISRTHRQDAEKPVHEILSQAYAAKDQAYAAVAVLAATALQGGQGRAAFTGGAPLQESGDRLVIPEDAIIKGLPVEVRSQDGTFTEDISVIETFIADDSVVSQRREHLYESGRRLLEALRKGGHDAFRPLLLQASLHHWFDCNGFVHEDEFCTEMIYHNGTLPLARGCWRNGEEDMVFFTDVESVESGVREIFWWEDDDVAALADAVAWTAGEAA